MFKRIETAAAIIFVSCGAFATTLEEGFKAPPDSAKPHTWYHLMNGNITKEGISCDFEAIANAGLGGVQMFDVGCSIPPGPVKFNSPEWFDMLAHANREAQRLGLEICVPNCSGWSSSGGPWNAPSNGMKKVVFTETSVKGPARFSAKLPRTEKDNGFYADIATLAYPTPSLPGATLEKLEAKTFASREKILESDMQASAIAPDAAIAKSSIIDLTGDMKEDGALDWDVPAGDWTILRIGYICNGRCNHPASETGRGLEVDKLSKEALDYHFEQYIGRLSRTLGVSPGKIAATGFNNILVDSYEVRSQNWTGGFDKTFTERNGYSIIPYLPVFAGRIVGSAEESERFLEDFRRTVADLFAENYAGRLAELCREHGLLCSIEPYGNCPADNLQYGQYADIPMAEYWSRVLSGEHIVDTGNSRLAAHLAHVWGRRYAATESFTADPNKGGKWRTTPFSIKAQGDRVYAEGINRIIYHRFVHQPWPGNKYLPGMTMGFWGMHLDRTQTWWPLAGDWFKYQSRCQWMLQEGVFVADALYFCGEQAPNEGCFSENGNTGRMKLPPGYDYDICAAKAIEELQVVDGRIVAPGGTSYAILVLPPQKTMSERMLSTIGRLLDAGAKVCAPVKPSRAPGLACGPDADKRLRARADEIWAKGVMECYPMEALKRLGIAPDFESTETDPKTGAVYIHRRNAGADWYFVALNNEKSKKFTASFRQSGRQPEIWDAEHGTITDACEWREGNGRTFVTLQFPPSGSAFVVFRKPAAGDHVIEAAVNVRSSPDPVPPRPPHTLSIESAVYGSFASNKTIDFTAALAALVKDGEVSAVIGNTLAGRDPAPKQYKEAHIAYIYDGKRMTAKAAENEIFSVPYGSRELDTPPAWEWRDGRIVAWQELSAVLTMADGAKVALAARPPRPETIDGSWQVQFPVEWYTGGTGTKTIELATLADWTKISDADIRFFSGTAVYSKRVSIAPPVGARTVLDLGDVRHFAEVSVNGKPFPVLWRPPFRVDITDALKPGQDFFELEIKVTNLWPNRLIGDDAMPPDCQWEHSVRRSVDMYGVKELPEWVKKGESSPAGRHTFTTWRHYQATDPLQPSGLLGPVLLRFGVEAKPAGDL
ncbi:MAG: hypothetical protein J6P13_01515 [Kiritimatiellae bacterium]|nr:hypothetical protein [Kiritimatiellia bacterium]